MLPGLLEKHSIPSRTNMMHEKLFLKVYWTNICRQKDVPYMTEEWKMAIRNKRKFVQLFAQNRTLENWELKRKWRKLATKERRRAIKSHWAQKPDELSKRPRDFYTILK